MHKLGQPGQQLSDGHSESDIGDSVKTWMSVGEGNISDASKQLQYLSKSGLCLQDLG